MKVSIHAAERFLQRVMSKADYTCFDINMVITYLEKVFKDVVPNSPNKHFVIPGFENYKAVYCLNTIVTIIPKGDKHAR